MNNVRIAVPLLVVVALLGGAGSPAAQVDFTFDRTMVKGAADAPVTIVEFSDYQ
jgi:protein-disulfide isomerase